MEGERFEELDLNHDKVIDRGEFSRARRKRAERGSSPHRGSPHRSSMRSGGPWERQNERGRSPGSHGSPPGGSVAAESPLGWFNVDEDRTAAGGQGELSKVRVRAGGFRRPVAGMSLVV